ncbi:MAG: SusD/RagB family nutrient-binding outer rane lipoprotein [Mucilaginibacter sp.]|nr:SusD/RagB family nutrient-binding outer rane lipoprotein [Mucilaginibacter sp.]
MKKRLIYSCLVMGASLFAGCTKNFDKINTDPNQTTAALINPNFFVSQSQINFSNPGYAQLLFQSMWVQGLAGTEGYYSNGDKYVQGGSFGSYLPQTWNECYNAGTLIYEMKSVIKGNAAYANLDNCGTILLALYEERVTDAYGDCPYSQAYQAKAGIYTPIFDKQQTIYTTILSQLATATAALDVSKAGPTSDLFYGGDVSKWKKLGYSLMLRAAMRLTKVDPTTAQKYAEMAYNGGAMASIADDAKVLCDNTNGNGNADAQTLVNNTPDFVQVRWSNTLISYLQSTNDPRIPAVAEISAGTGLAANSTYAPGINTPNLQIGMPNGYDLNGGPTDISHAPNYPGPSPAASSTDAPAPLGKYSRPRFSVYDDLNGANMILTYGETELLFAEAASRGWATGVAATHYANALAADMQELVELNATPQAVVDPTSIAVYVAAHPLLPATALQQINMEYFVEACTSFDFNEAWNNWKRSGYPALVPVVYPGQFTNGSIPRRIEYPASLTSTNPANYAAAVASMGGDTFITKVWWDK